MKKPALMNEAYPNGDVGNGIFSDLQTLEVPWSNEDIDTELDIIYYSKSGDKSCSDIILKRLDTSGILSNVSRAEIANALFALFGAQWAKLYETLSFEYNPIENYRMIESEEVETHNKNSGTETGTIDRDATNARTDTGTISNSGTESNANNVYGFNSSDAVNSDASSGSVNNTETRNLSIGESVDETETRNLANSSESDDTQNRELTRSGNIGVTTSQQMIESERALWRWNFFSTVFEDIDSVLCLDIYNYDDMED